jgi:hypothetical protein
MYYKKTKVNTHSLVVSFLLRDGRRRKTSCFCFRWPSKASSCSEASFKQIYTTGFCSYSRLHTVVLYSSYRLIHTTVFINHRRLLPSFHYAMHPILLVTRAYPYNNKINEPNKYWSERSLSPGTGAPRHWHRVAPIQSLIRSVYDVNTLMYSRLLPEPASGDRLSPTAELDAK